MTSTDPWHDLCALARLNHAVWRARRNVHSARAGVSCERRDATKISRMIAAARIAKASEQEALARFALSDAVAAWRAGAPPLRARVDEALRRRERFGATTKEVIAAMTARFGAADEKDWPSEGPRGDWSRTFTARRCVSDRISFGVSESNGRGRVHIYCNGRPPRYVHADVGLPSETVRRIRSCEVPTGADMVPPETYSEKHDREWSWTAALTVEEATAPGWTAYPVLSTVAVALDGCALLIDEADAYAASLRTDEAP